MHILIYQLNKISEKKTFIHKLSRQVQERTIELASANKNLENLLHQILPVSVAMSLSRGEAVTPEHFDSVSMCPSIFLRLYRISLVMTLANIPWGRGGGIWGWGCYMRRSPQTIFWGFWIYWPKIIRTLELSLICHRFRHCHPLI